MTRALACAAGVVALPAVALLALLAALAPVSAWGFAYVLGLAWVTAGAITAPLRRARRRGVTRAGLALLALVVAARLAAAGDGATLHATVLPAASPGGGRALARLIDEEDLAVGGARWLPLAGAIPPSEGPELLAAMRRSYAAMRAAEGATPSPVVPTYLGLQDPRAFDALVVDAPTPSPRVGVVFLHGFAGNFAMPCWSFAQAARAAGAVTLCPSTGWRGDWWTPRGERTARAAIAHLRARGVRRVVLAGLSAGGVGASRLAPRLAREVDGLILVSGASSSGGTGGLPTLVVHGRDDRMAPAATARALARAAPRATYLETPGGHFVLIEREAQVRPAIAQFLARIAAP